MATTSARPESSTTSSWRQSGEEARGASQIGPFDYCPRVGFREYWYPGVWAAKVGRKRPVKVRMLGEDIVLFRGTKGDVVALTDWCPHRGARLSLGECDFVGTVTCPYHGYVFDETGQCVAGLIESVNSPLAPKLRAKNYPTAERNGIVFIWMGMTTPVPLEDDLPWEFLDDSLNTTRHARVRSWETNWTEPTWQGIDYHEFYLHRRTKFWHLIDHKLPFLRPKPVVTNGIQIIDEGENYVACIQRGRGVRAERISRTRQVAPPHVVATIAPSSKEGHGIRCRAHGTTALHRPCPGGSPPPALERAGGRMGHPGLVVHDFETPSDPLGPGL